jgi:phage terminase large subunit
MTDDDFWFMNGRLRRAEGTRQLRLECNYDGHNWIYKQFNQNKIGTLFTTNTFDNEKNLPPDYIETLKKLPKKLQERHLYGSDADMEGLVWDEFSAGRHIVAPFEIPKAWDKVVVLDHGMTNPTAVLWGAIDYDGNIYIVDEHYEAGQIVSHHAEAIRSRDNSNVKEWLIDPSCGAKNREKNGQQYSVIEEYRDNGLFFIPANNEVLGGINRVSEYLKTDRLKIFKSCTNLIEEIGQYKWQKLKPGVQKNAPEAPMKHKDHACDCLRYLISSRPESPVELKKVSYEAHAQTVFNPFVPIQNDDERVEINYVGQVDS